MTRKPAQMRDETRDRMRGGEGSVTIRHCFEKSEFAAPVRLCSWLIIPPGAGIGPHAHEKEDEIFMVARGTGIIEDGTAQVRVGPGDAILTGKGGSHAVRNDGTCDLEIAAIIVTYPS
jgi:mannose-6-phosphate isomerase-like protein (cupin superfamily)